MDAVTRPRPQPISLDGADAPTFFDSVGGHDTFEALVSGFYARVPGDPILSRLLLGRLRLGFRRDGPLSFCGARRNDDAGRDGQRQTRPGRAQK